MSSTVPSTSPITTQSPIWKGRSTSSITPAKRLPAVSWAASERVRPTSPALVIRPVTGSPSSCAAIRMPKMNTTTLYTLTRTLCRVLLARSSSRVPASSSPVSAEAPYSPWVSSRMRAKRNTLSRKTRAPAAAHGREARARYSPAARAIRAAGRAKLSSRMPAAAPGQCTFRSRGKTQTRRACCAAHPAAASSAAQAQRAAKAAYPSSSRPKKAKDNSCMAKSMAWRLLSMRVVSPYSNTEPAGWQCGKGAGGGFPSCILRDVWYTKTRKFVSGRGAIPHRR